MIRQRLILLVFAVLLAVPALQAQVFKTRNRAASPPKALIVMLLTRGGQRAHLTQYRPDRIPEFEKDVREVNTRIVKDFSRNFKFCPVYFVADTNVNQLASGDWKGILFDSTMQPVTKTVIRPGSRDYFIAHYGGPTPQPDSVRASTPGDLGAESEVYGEDPTGLFQEKLLVAGPDFRLLTTDKGPKTPYARSLRPVWMNGQEYMRYRRELTYNARYWFIDYMPSAYPYDVALRKYFRTNKNRR